MRSFARVAALALITALGLPVTGIAQDLIPPSRMVVAKDTDLPGGDVASAFDTTHEACERGCLSNTQCEAYTFNSRNGSCFLKKGPGAPAPFEGAFSAFKLQANADMRSRAATRRVELTFIDDGDVASASRQAAELGRAYPTGTSGVEELLATAAAAENRGDWDGAAYATAAALSIDDRSELWTDFARRSRESGDATADNRDWNRARALRASINAYLRADSAAERHNALVELGRALERQARGKDTVQALRLAQEIQPRDDTAAELADAAGKYGFRIADNTVESDLAVPRICAQFTDNLAPGGVEYSDFVKLQQSGLAVDVDQRQLCVTGIEHGKRYEVTFRQGLPAADGQVLAKDVTLNFYVRDRSPAVRATGRGYVLPRTAEAAVPVETVNTDTLDLTLYRLTDRNLLRSIQSYYFGSQVYDYDESQFNEEIGDRIWTGTATVPREVNRDITTRLPLAEALKGQPAGIYALKAALPGTDPWENAPAWQWFVISDLGLTSFSGVDGLHVAVMGLGDALPRAGVAVQLLSRTNEILGETTTNDAGYARFDAGLTRGGNGTAPAMIVAQLGDDLTFLSLTDPEFDLSDRGVAGREPAPPVDVFLTTDRGAYRAGETVNVTALARNPEVASVDGLPLTAILRRPDGVEYSRQLVEDVGAGGHVFALPIAGSAPRGVWSLAVYADPEGAALRSATFLVEDFLPERIDFTLAMEDEKIVPNAETPSTLVVDAKYLFGPPAAGLAIEGEVFVSAASNVAAWPDFVFGRYDQPFTTQMGSLSAGETMEDGKAYVDVNFPTISGDPGRPLTWSMNVRVAEGSGRPVERKLSGDMAPVGPMIGIKTEFDIAPESGNADFQLIALDADLQPLAMPVEWTVTRLENRYQWYQSYGNWNWERVTYRTVVSKGQTELGAAAVAIKAPVEWGDYELKVTRLGSDEELVATRRFYAGWYVPADSSATPDTLELSLDKPAYAVGETAKLRVVPRAGGTALVTVLSNRLVEMQSIEVKEGENIIPLNVTEEWGAGVYVTTSVLRPMDVASGRNPTRAMGLAYAAIDPGQRALTTKVEVADEVAPRGPMDIAVKVDGVAAGEQAYVTVAAVDVGILNLTGFAAPDPKDHYFGQRRLGVGIRDVYGRLIDGLNGAQGEVRSGGDAGAQSRSSNPPPTEELVAYFAGPLTVDADGYARISFDMPSFNGTVKVMAVAWSKTGVGQDSKDVLVRDPVVVTASLPRFMSPGDESRMLLEIIHATGPAGKMKLAATADGVTLGDMPSDITLAEKGKQVVSVPLRASAVGVHELTVTLTTPDGKELVKTLVLPVQVNDPEINRISRIELKKGQSFTFDQAAFTGLVPGSGKSVMAIGPISRMNAPGLLAGLDRYPYGCTEQMTSRALPLIYFDQVARVMDLKGSENIRERIEQAVSEILTNQGSEGGFGLWRAGSGDMWLDAYVTDFLSRARTQGYAVPDLAFRSALNNLRNQVNSAPDFDQNSNGGGTALAYALMVLAREGAAAIGDLRYYADVKADDFATPLAQAQLGAALASYGDQTRADAMFRKAGAQMQLLAELETQQIWRADYGTNLRDSAAILTLAVEAGSNAVDREALVSRIAMQSGNLSTQEATWALMATNALIDRPDVQGILIDGKPADGPLVRVLTDGQAPVLVTNEGTDTSLTLSTYGVPDEPVPAGGNGYAITRSYFTLEGEEIQLSDGVQAGTRMVVVLDIAPFERSDGRLIVADPLPAGFEIDNPNLIDGGSTSQLGWLNTTRNSEHSEFRQDRFISQVNWTSSSPLRLAYIVRAISPGTFHHPAASVEDMYRPDFRAWTDAGTVEISAN